MVKVSKLILLGLSSFLAAVSMAQMAAPVRTPTGTIDKTKGIGVDQKLGAMVPLNLQFVNSKGQSVTLAQYFGKTPVILNLVYYRCKSVCTLEAQNLAATVQKLDAIKAAPHLGKDFQVLTISINPQENSQDAQQKRNGILTGFSPSQAAGWHFLTGTADSIQKLVTSIGFHFTYDPSTDLINHPASLELLSPQGKVAQYFFSDTYPPDKIAGALITAKGNKIGKKAQYVFFGCLCCDPITGKYSVNIFRVVQIFGTLTVLMIGGSVGLWSVKNRHRAKNFRSDKNQHQ